MQKPGLLEVCVCTGMSLGMVVYWAPQSQKRTPEHIEKVKYGFCHSPRLCVAKSRLAWALTLLIYSEVSPKLSLNPEIFANQQ